MTYSDKPNKKKLTKSEVGRLGALARIKKHGNPGTTEGRSKGGIHSLVPHKKLQTGFYIKKSFHKPRESARLAEFIGIMVGDGHLTKYQASMSTSPVTDIEHAQYVKKLAASLFRIEPFIRYKKDSKALEVVLSSVGLVDWLKTKGMPGGNKMKELRVPEWIMKRKLFQKRFIRGLFDTDGCVFGDRHVIKGKVYPSSGWTITSFSGRLRSEVVAVLQGLGFHPTLRDSQVSIHMRRKSDIDTYFKEIGTSNTKHQKRYLLNK